LTDCRCPAGAVWSCVIAGWDVSLSKHQWTSALSHASCGQCRHCSSAGAWTHGPCRQTPF